MLAFPKPGKTKTNKQSISKLKAKLLLLVKEYVRRRDNWTCQKSGERVSGSNCHVSHVIPVSHGNALAFDPMNMKVLSYHWHLNWWHKNPLESAEWFRTKFPDRWQYLQLHRNDVVHWKESDYLRMIEEWKQKLG